MKTTTVNGAGKGEAKYLALIEDYLRQIKQVRADMKRSQTEINRLKASSRRKLTAIDAVLHRVEATR
ncbi:MAG: hypothetical protein HYY24_20865 [Verrucomicrobia bacterium]|nr:hypothetical protein [Verrucomicrobiota bacterium]